MEIFDIKNGGILTRIKLTKKLFVRIFLHFIFLCHHNAVWFFILFILLPQINLDENMWDLCTYSAGYATNWNIMFQTIFLSLSLSYDVLEWLDKNDSNFGRKMKFVRDVLFCSWVLPLTLFISCMFWSIYWIDRELVFPRVYDQVVPWWFNQCVHTNIVVVVVVETLLQPRRHPTNFKLESFANGFITFLYAIVYYSIYFITNRWLYGVFGIMTWWQVCLFQVLIWISCYFFYFIQFPINRLIHKDTSEFGLKEKSRSYEFGNHIGKTSDWNSNIRNGKQIQNSVL